MANCRELHNHAERLTDLNREHYLRILDYCGGGISEEELLKAEAGCRWNLCETHFYVALDRLAQGDRAGAREHFQKAVATRVLFFVEYEFSRLFLKRMDQDPNWPRWIPLKEPATQPDTANLDAPENCELNSLDIEAEMYNSNSTCYIRIPFVVMNTKLTDLKLNMRYDDGFIAYLNGAEVLRVNFDAAAIPEWDSAASASHDDAAAVVLESFDISDFGNLLRSGLNLLAIHGLNTSKADSDFLISVELVAHGVSQGDVAPSATSSIQRR